MSANRKYVMSIAGFDPSGGAGLLADIKTFEQHKVYGFSVITATTLQTENNFYSIQWTAIKDVINAVDILLATYPIQVIKTGVVPSFDFLFELVTHIKNINPTLKIIVDPIIKSSTGFDFQDDIKEEKMISVLKNIFLLTPNTEEVMLLSDNTDAETASNKLSQYCNVLLKGGHHKTAIGVDYLFTENTLIKLKPTRKNLKEKHGSGCVLSAAIVSNLALGYDLKTSCINAKKYVEQFLNSNTSLLGYHHV